VGYRFSLVLSREITDEESAVLREAGCSAAVFGTGSLPANAEVNVTSMDFDDTVSPTLAVAIESALEAVKEVPGLSVPGLTVPVQPAGPADEEPKVVAGEVIEEVAAEVIEEVAAEVIEEVAAEVAGEVAAEVAGKKPAAGKATARKSAPRKKAEITAGSD